MLLIDTLKWYIAIQILSLFAFLFTFKLFSNREDKGYCISKIIGIAIPAFISWLIIAFSNGEIGLNFYVSLSSVILFIIAGITYVLTQYKKQDYKDFITFFDRRFKLILVTELGFITIMLAGAFVRGFSPDILGRYKLLDLVYTNSFIYGQSIQPENLWFTGNPINVPYFSYILFGNLSNLCPLPIYSEFNLMPGTIISLLTIISGSFIYNVTKNKTYGILGGIITPFITTFFTFIFIVTQGVNNNFSWIIPPFQTLEHYEVFTPLDHFLFGELQPTFLFMPLLITFMFLLFSVLKDNLTLNKEPISIDKVFSSLIIVIFLCILILTNVYSSILALIILFLFLIYIINNNNEPKKNIKFYLLNAGMYITGTALVLIPFITSFKAQEIYITIINFKDPAFIKGMLLVFSSFLLPILIYLLIQYKNHLKLNIKHTILTLLGAISLVEVYFLINAKLSIAIIPVIISIILAIIAFISIYIVYKDNNTIEFKNRLLVSIPILALLIIEYIITNNVIIVLSSILLLYSGYKCYNNKDLTSFITFSLLLLSSITIILLNILNISVNTENNNLINNNILSNLSIITSLCIVLTIFQTEKYLNGFSKEVYITGISLLLLPCFIFILPGTALNTSYFRFLAELTPCISGINHMKFFHKAEFEAINWIKEYTTPNSIILEAIKDGEPFCGRISGYSNRLNLINWPHIQKNLYDKKTQKIIATKTADIHFIYEEPDKTKVLPIIDNYNISYIFVGEVEKELYTPESLTGFQDIATNSIRFNDEQGKEAIIYQLN